MRVLTKELEEDLGLKLNELSDTVKDVGSTIQLDLDDITTTAKNINETVDAFLHGMISLIGVACLCSVMYLSLKMIKEMAE